MSSSSFVEVKFACKNLGTIIFYFVNFFVSVFYYLIRVLQNVPQEDEERKIILIIGLFRTLFHIYLLILIKTQLNFVQYSHF